MKSIRAQIQFKATSEGGRQHPFYEGNCPHVVVEGSDEWLGVRVVHCPALVQPGDKRVLELELMYYPRLDYQGLVPGARFSMVEGAKVIGTGVVLE
jgi:translation elongation factor EF-Tu-like GTPase